MGFFGQVGEGLGWGLVVFESFCLVMSEEGIAEMGVGVGREAGFDEDTGGLEVFDFLSLMFFDRFVLLRGMGRGLFFSGRFEEVAAGAGVGLDEAELLELLQGVVGFLIDDNDIFPLPVGGVF